MMIKIMNLSKMYGNDEALNNVTVEIHEGKIYGLFGNNGSGKTTLINIIARRIFQTEGLIEVDGNLLLANSNVNHLVFCTNNERYIADERYKGYLRRISRLNGHFDYSIAINIMKSFNMKDNQFLYKLTDRQHSIFKISMAFAMNAKYTFFDESTLHLDAKDREQFYKILLKMYNKTQNTYVIATHYIDEVENLTEDVIVIDQGRIIEETSIEAIQMQEISLVQYVSSKVEVV
ncbi:MAG: ATP-binding cassette domain-containing protein [Erysipelothrix sp.]|nr:ATP-binding cassette domain-containing protein [Erysipelothrix sp.]